MRALAQQTNLNILLSGRLADDVITNPLKGSFTPAEAVKQMVAGTSLGYAIADEHTFTIWNCAEFRCVAGDSIDSDAQQPGNRATDSPSQRPAAERPVSVEQVDVNGVRTPLEDYAPQPWLIRARTRS